jgi:hypothetical protein
MKACNTCFCKIEGDEVDVTTYGHIEPHQDLEFCSWKCFVKWVEAHREELIVAKALGKMKR